VTGDQELRETVAGELGRHQGLRGPMVAERPDVWQNRCECGWDDGDERPGWRERYRLHIADALLALLPDRDDGLRGRVEALAEEWVADDGGGPPPSGQGSVSPMFGRKLRAALDSPPTPDVPMAESSGHVVEQAFCTATHDVPVDELTATYHCQVLGEHEQHRDSEGTRW
jgi:hypothetical protein